LIEYTIDLPVKSYSYTKAYNIMLNFFRRKAKQTDSTLNQGLQKTRNRFLSGIERVFLGKKTIDAEMLSTIETQLISADVGVETSQNIIKDLIQQIDRKTIKDPEALMQALVTHMSALLEPYQKPLNIPKQNTPYTILMVGVNGAGKTTTLGKLAHHLKSQQLQPLLAAGDTFRAAAIEQLFIWGERNNVPVIAQKHGADSASVIFDAMQAAQARNIDVVLADTAGRLHTQNHLMDELQKITRVMQKFDPKAPNETILVLDASMGQNALQQAKQFQQAVNVDSIILTKLDGTAKGGIVFAITKQLQLPIRFVGLGEKIDDLKPFHATEFVEALFYDTAHN
jgi:fused signal recognition particle receptor